MISWYQRHTYLLVLDVATVATPLTLKCLLLKSRCSRREVCGAVHVSICLRKIHPLTNCQGEGVPIFESKNVTFWKIKLKKFRVQDVLFYSSCFKMILFRSFIPCHHGKSSGRLRPRFSTEAWERRKPDLPESAILRNSTEKEVDRFNPPKTGTEKWNFYTTTSTSKTKKNYQIPRPCKVDQPFEPISNRQPSLYDPKDTTTKYNVSAASLPSTPVYFLTSKSCQIRFPKLNKTTWF